MPDDLAKDVGVQWSGSSKRGIRRASRKNIRKGDIFKKEITDRSERRSRTRERREGYPQTPRKLANKLDDFPRRPQ